MEMTLREAQERYSGLNGLADLKLPVKLRWAVACNLDALKKHVDRAGKVQRELYEQYAEKDEDGKPKIIERVNNGKRESVYDTTPQAELQILKDFQALLDDETVEVNIRTAPLSLVVDAEKEKGYDVLTVAQQTALVFMLTE